MTAAQLPTAVRGAGGSDRLSTLDEAFLYLERPNQPMHIGCVAELDGALALSELLELLSARLLPVRRFRQRPVRSLLHLRGARWEDDPAFELRAHVRHVALPPPGDEEALQHVVETLFSSPLPPDRPLWEVHLVDGLPGGRSALLCKVHHCLTDGVSGLGILEQLADPRPDARRAVRDAGSSAAGASPPCDADASGTRLEPASVLRRARDVAAALDMIASFVQTPVTPLPFNGRLGHGRRMLWRSFPLDELDSIRAASDCTVNDAVLAIVSGALRSYLEECGLPPEEARVRALVPVSVRAEDAPGALGNLVTAVFPWLPVEVADPIERVTRIRDEMRALKGREMARATGVLLGVLGALPSPLEAALCRLVPDTPLVSIGCTNVRGPRAPLALLGRRIVEIHPIMNLFPGVGLAFAVASYAGRMSVCAATNPRLVPDGERVLAGVESSLYELRTAYWSRSTALRVARRLAEQPRVADLMTREVATAQSGKPEQRALEASGAGHLSPSDSALDAVRLMAERKVDALPVVDDAGRFVGFFSQEHLVRWTTASARGEA